MTRLPKVLPKYEAELRDRPRDLWQEDPRLAGDHRSIPQIHEGTVEGSYTNHTCCGIRYTEGFTRFMGSAIAREVLMRDFITPEEFRQLLGWKDAGKVRRALRKGALRGRQPSGQDGSWEIPVRAVLAYMEANAYVPSHIESVRRQCVELVRKSA